MSQGLSSSDRMWQNKGKYVVCNPEKHTQTLSNKDDSGGGGIYSWFFSLFAFQEWQWIQSPHLKHLCGNKQKECTIDWKPNWNTPTTKLFLFPIKNKTFISVFWHLDTKSRLSTVLLGLKQQCGPEQVESWVFYTTVDDDGNQACVIEQVDTITIGNCRLGRRGCKKPKRLLENGVCNNKYDSFMCSKQKDIKNLKNSPVIQDTLLKIFHHQLCSLTFSIWKSSNWRPSLPHDMALKFLSHHY